MPTPLEIFGADLGLHLRAEDIGQADNTEVASWTDTVSGKGLVAAQSNIVRRPTLYTNELDGMPAVGFDGVDDYLDIPSNVHTHVAEPTVFVILRWPGIKWGWNNVMGIAHDSTQHVDPYARVGLALFFDDADTGRYDIRRGASVISDAATNKTAIPYVLALHIANLALYENGDLTLGAHTTGTASYPNVTPFRIGAHSTGGENAGMLLCELIYVKRNATTNERALVNSYAQDKYPSISVSDYIAPTSTLSDTYALVNGVYVQLPHPAVLVNGTYV